VACSKCERIPQQGFQSNSVACDPSGKTLSEQARLSGQRGISAQAVLRELVELQRAEKSDPTEVEELVRVALAECQDVVGVDDHFHAGVVELANRVAPPGMPLRRWAETAKALDNTVPPSLFARAGEVVE
jgi:hypothetical protein